MEKNKREYWSPRKKRQLDFKGDDFEKLKKYAEDMKDDLDLISFKKFREENEGIYPKHTDSLLRLLLIIELHSKAKTRQEKLELLDTHNQAVQERWAKNPVMKNQPYLFDLMKYFNGQKVSWLFLSTPISR